MAEVAVAAAGLLAVAIAGCGTLAPDGAGASNLPSSGAGPYKRLDGSRSTPLTDPVASLDDPQVFVEPDGRVIVWFTRRPATGIATIQRAVFTDLDDEDATPTIETALEGGQAWEAGGVSQPGLLPPTRDGAPWLMFYTAGGRVGLARSMDGVTFTKEPTPVLEPDAASGEGSALGSPMALRIEGGAGAASGTPLAATLRLLYLAEGAIHAADSEIGVDGETSPRFRRVDALPSTPERDPVLAPRPPWLSQMGRFTARTVETPAGRVRHDLFLSGRIEAARVVGMGGSYDGRMFSVAAAPFISVRPPEEWAPTVAVRGEGSLLMFTTAGAGRSVIGAAVWP